MKKIISLSFLIVLVGCEESKEFYKEDVDNKKYFTCSDQYDRSINSTLIIDIDENKLFFANLTFKSFEEQDRGIIYAEDTYALSGARNMLSFNIVDGSLMLQTYNTERLKMTSTYNYKCKKVEPLV